MKKLFLSLTAFVCSTALFAQTDAAKPAQGGKKVADVAKFESETVNLGKIKQENPSTATFTITNISNEPLLIEQANPTCGCTIGDYTKSPIAPGKTGTITATYNAKNVGPFDKHLTVKFAGVEETKSIAIKGEVLTADAYAALNGGTATEAKTTTTSTQTKVTPVKTPGKKVVKKSSSTTKATTISPAPKS